MIEDKCRQTLKSGVSVNHVGSSSSRSRRVSRASRAASGRRLSDIVARLETVGIMCFFVIDVAFDFDGIDFACEDVGFEGSTAADLQVQFESRYIVSLLGM